MNKVLDTNPASGPHRERCSWLVGLIFENKVNWENLVAYRERIMGKLLRVYGGCLGVQS